MSADTANDNPVREPDGNKAKKKLTLPPVDPMLKAEVHSRTLLEIEGIGVAYASRLAQVGIKSLQNLFAYGATRKGREELAAKSGIAERYILSWVAHADLMRVRGIGPEYADLLEEAGVDTPVELAHRLPENLYHSLLKVSKEKRLTRRPPSLKQVTEWVHQAKRLPRAVEY